MNQSLGLGLGVGPQSLGLGLGLETLSLGLVLGLETQSLGLGLGLVDPSLDYITGFSMYMAVNAPQKQSFNDTNFAQQVMVAFNARV